MRLRTLSLRGQMPCAARFGIGILPCNYFSLQAQRSPQVQFVQVQCSLQRLVVFYVSVSELRVGLDADALNRFIGMVPNMSGPRPHV
jgi:hypothetical protein